MIKSKHSEESKAKRSDSERSYAIILEVEKGKRYTCIGSGHSYHMVPVPDAIDEYGQPLKARCDRDHELMNYTVACGICNTAVGWYRVDFITHQSVFCDKYGSVEKVSVNY